MSVPGSGLGEAKRTSSQGNMQKAERKPSPQGKPSLWALNDADKPRKLPPVPSEFSLRLPEESWWLPTQPPMGVSAEQPGLGSSPPGPQLQLHPHSPLSLVSLSPPSHLSSLPSFPVSSFPPVLPPSPLPLSIGGWQQASSSSLEEAEKRKSAAHVVTR